MKAQNKILIKNTVAQYIKIIISIIVTLISTRIILQQLGVSDYGIFSVIAGLISFLGVLNNSMIVSVQRFLAYEIPTGNIQKLSKIYSTSIFIHIGIGLVIFFLAETIGIYFVKNFMIFSPDKLDDVIVVFHCVALSFVINVISIPQQAILIAYEKIFLSSIVGIIEVFLKLLVAIALFFVDQNKLIFYVVFFVIVSLVIRIIYSLLVKLNIKNLKFYFSFDMSIYRQLIGFAGWNLLGAIANIGKIQGVNVILNMFFGTTVNAAYGIANQVNSQLLFFSSSIFQASNSQVIQSYRKNDNNRLKFLVFQTSRFSFILFFMVALPVFTTIDDLLFLWLGQLPEYCGVFIKLMILNSCVELFSTPLMYITQATGRIRNYFIIISSIMILIIPVSFLFLKLGFGPQNVLVITIVVNLILLYIRMIFVKRNTEFEVRQYAVQVIVKAFFIVVFLCFILGIVNLLVSSWSRIVLAFLISPLLVGGVSYILLLSDNEKKVIIDYVCNAKNKIGLFR